MLQKAESRDVVHDGIGVDGWIINHGGFDVEVFLVLGLQHLVGNVRHVHPGVRLAGDVHLTTLQVEGVHKVLPESHKLMCDIELALSGGCSL